MAALSELAKRVLSELEEVRVQNVIAMLNTIILPAGAGEELERLRTALLELVDAGFVEMGMERFHPHEEVVLGKVDGEQLINTLGASLTFDTDRRSWDWRDGEMLTSPYPIILATPGGVEEGGRILSEHGYQWWKKRVPAGEPQ